MMNHKNIGLPGQGSFYGVKVGIDSNSKAFYIRLSLHLQTVEPTVLKT